MRVKDFSVKTDESKIFDSVSVLATAKHIKGLVDFLKY